jgi:hypothetical protein
MQAHDERAAEVTALTAQVNGFHARAIGES